MLDALGKQHIELGIGHAAVLAAVIGSQLAFVAKLSLPRRVIHEREQPDFRPPDQLPGFRDDIRHRHFAAQMQEVLDPEQVARARGRNGIGKDLRFAVDVACALFAPDPQRIEHGGDAAGGELAVVGDDSGHRVPVHLGPRHVVRLEMIGVQLDQARKQQIAGQILPGEEREEGEGRDQNLSWLFRGRDVDRAVAMLDDDAARVER